MKTINLKKTGDHLRRLCKEQGYSVHDLQNYLHIGSNQAIYNWFNGKSLPSIDNLAALADLLDYTINELLVLEEL